MSKKYLVIVNWIIPEDTNKKSIKVTAKQLAELYGINPEECHLFEEEDMDKPLPKGHYVILGPRPKGDYKEYLELVNRRHRHD
jgi:hypothetical protein